MSPWLSGGGYGVAKLFILTWVIKTAEPAKKHWGIPELIGKCDTDVFIKSVFHDLGSD